MGRETKQRWVGRWECHNCGETGDSSTVQYRVINHKYSLRCPNCGQRVVQIDRQDTENQRG